MNQEEDPVNLQIFVPELNVRVSIVETSNSTRTSSISEVFDSHPKRLHLGREAQVTGDAAAGTASSIQLRAVPSAMRWQSRQVPAWGSHHPWLSVHGLRTVPRVEVQKARVQDAQFGRETAEGDAHEGMFSLFPKTSSPAFFWWNMLIEEVTKSWRNNYKVFYVGRIRPMHISPLFLQLIIFVCALRSLLMLIFSQGQLKKFMDYVQQKNNEKVEKMCAQGLDANFHDSQVREGWEADCRMKGSGRDSTHVGSRDSEQQSCYCFIGWRRGSHWLQKLWRTGWIPISEIFITLLL